MRVEQRGERPNDRPTLAHAVALAERDGGDADGPPRRALVAPVERRRPVRAVVVGQPPQAHAPYAPPPFRPAPPPRSGVVQGSDAHDVVSPEEHASRRAVKKVERGGRARAAARPTRSRAAAAAAAAAAGRGETASTDRRTRAGRADTQPWR